MRQLGSIPKPNAITIFVQRQDISPIRIELLFDSVIWYMVVLKECENLIGRFMNADWSNTSGVREIIKQYQMESFWDLTDDRKVYEERDVLLFIVAAYSAGLINVKTE